MAGIISHGSDTALIEEDLTWYRGNPSWRLDAEKTGVEKTRMGVFVLILIHLNIN